MTGRTLVVTNDFPPRRGGIETYVRSWCDARSPDEVVVHTARMTGAAAADRARPYPVVRDPAPVLLPTPAVARRVVATLRRYGCDRVVFGASVPLGLLAPRLRQAGARHLTAMTHGHEVWWAALPGTRSLLRAVGESVDVLTYVSGYCRDRIAPALSPEAAARLEPLLPAVDRARFHPGCGGDAVRRRLGIAPQALVVVCVGRLVRRKGQDTLVRIWPEVLRRFPGAVLLLVGDGPERRRLRRLAEAHGVAGSVLLAGSVPWEEVPAHLDAGDVFAMPCRERRWGLEVEAFGIVYLEAAACGLTVVPGRSGGAVEAAQAARALQAACGEHVVGGRGRASTTAEAAPGLVSPGAASMVQAPARSGSAAGGGDGRAGADLGAGAAEDVLDDAAEAEDDDDDEGRDGGDEQAVLDGGRAGLVLAAGDEALEEAEHGILP